MYVKCRQKKAEFSGLGFRHWLMSLRSLHIHRLLNLAAVFALGLWEEVLGCLVGSGFVLKVDRRDGATVRLHR
jgi:hypothetical protein